MPSFYGKSKGRYRPAGGKTDERVPSPWDFVECFRDYEVFSTTTFASYDGDVGEVLVS